MNEFETIDNDISDGGISPNLRSLASTIGQWAKIIAIINIATQVLNFILSFVNNGVRIGTILGSLIGTIISIALYVSLLKYGTAMSSFSEKSNMRSLEAAIEREQYYWQFIGVLCIIAVVIFLIGFAAFGSDISALLEVIARQM